MSAIEETTSATQTEPSAIREGVIHTNIVEDSSSTITSYKLNGDNFL